MIWFRPTKDRDIPVYYRKQYKKARYKRKSERLAPGYWDSYVKCNGFNPGPENQPCPPPPKGVSLFEDLKEGLQQTTEIAKNNK